MRKIVILIIIMATIVSVSFGQAAKGTSDSNEELQKLDNSIFLARMMPLLAGASLNNKMLVSDLNIVLASEYTRIDSQGRLFTKMQELESLNGSALPTSRKGNKENTHVEQYGDTGLVRCIVTIHNEENYDFEATGRYFVTNVYIKREGHWRLVSSQWTHVSE